MNRLIFPVFLALSCLLACQPEIPAPGGDLNDLYHTWTLLGIETDNKWETVPKELNAMTMTLNAQLQAALQSSCNQGGGDFVIDSNGSISFSATNWTEAYCGGLGDEWETLYINGLASVDRFSFSDNEFWLWSDTLSLRFER